MKEHDEQQQGEQSMLPSLPSISKHQALITGGTLVAGELAGFIADAAMHSVTHNGMFMGLVATGMVAYNSKKLSDMFMPKPASEIAEKTERIINTVAPITEVHPDQSPIAKLKRLAGLPTPPPTWPKDTSDDEDVYEPEEAEPEAPYAEVQRTMTAYELLASGTLGNEILLGYDKDGNEIRRTWKQLKAILILGLQGGGKTTTACWLMAQALSQGARLAVIDKHAKSEEDSMLQKIEPFMSFFDCHPGEDPESSLQVVRHVKRVFENRLDGAPCDYPLLLVVDEFSAIMAQASKDESRWQECAKELATLIEELNFEGRKHKVYAICIGQATNATRTGGTEIRDLFNTRIVHGMRTKQAQMLSLNEYAKDIRSLDLGQVIVDMEGREEPFFAQVPYLSDKDIKAIAGRIQTPAMARRLPESGNLEDVLASNNLSVEDLLKLISRLPDVDPTDSRYTNHAQPVVHEQRVQQTPWPMFERMPDLPAKSQAQQREETKLQRALQLWNAGHASVRKLEAASGWSNGETRRIIQALKEKGLIYRDA